MKGDQLIRQINDRNVPPGELAVWWLGQHSFVVKAGKTVFYLDPFLTALKGRRVPPPLTSGQVSNADFVLGSHDHLDHIDRPAWPGIAQASPRAAFVVPQALLPGLAQELGIAEERFIGLDDGATLERQGVRLSAIPAAHEFLDRDPAGRCLYLGFVVQANGCTLYHAGDTCIYEGMQAKLRQWNLDVMFLPINGRDAKRLAAGVIGNMTYQEAADLGGVLAPVVVVPTHFDMFAGNLADPQAFAEYVRVKYPRQALHVPVLGEPFVVRAGG